MRAEVRVERVCELCVHCRCVRAFFDLRCAIALFILVDREADEYVIRTYLCTATYTYLHGFEEKTNMKFGFCFTILMCSSGGGGGPVQKKYIFFLPIFFNMLNFFSIFGIL